MKRFRKINYAEIKANAITKAKEAAGDNLVKAIRLVKKYYNEMVEEAIRPITNLKTLQPDN